jgi:hypothetical protein
MTVQKKLIAVNFTKGGNQKLGLVIHTQVGNLDGTDAWFHNKDSGVSSHYGIDLDGSRVFQWVEENDQAYSQGLVSKPTFKLTTDRPGINPNTYCISIECADNNDPAGADRSKQLPVLVELVKDICQRNNIPMDRDHICGHREIRSTKTCPGNINVDEVVGLLGVVPPSNGLWIKSYLSEKTIDISNEGDARARLGEVFTNSDKYEEADAMRKRVQGQLAEAEGEIASLTKENVHLKGDLQTTGNENIDLKKAVADRDATIYRLQSQIPTATPPIVSPVASDSWLNKLIKWLVRAR